MTTKSSVGYDFFQRMHEKNLPAAERLFEKISQGVLKVVDIRVDEPEFGHTRVVIFLHDTEE